MKKTILLLTTFTLCFSVFTSFGQTSVSAIISSDQIWDVAGSPYQLGSNVQLVSGVTLSILPGVVIESASNSELLVRGELQVLGNEDSLIVFNNVRIKLDEYADAYDPVTQSGALFNYAKFTNTIYSQYVFINRAKGCCIKNSLFLLGGNGFQSSPLTEDSSFFEMTHCSFTNFGPYEFSNVLVHGGLTEQIITNCVFDNINTVTFWRGHGMIKENVFENLNSVRFDTDENYEIHCNEFLNLMGGVHIYPKGGVISFKHNTLDSCGSSLQNNPYGLLNIATDSSLVNGVGTLDITNNNFLTPIGQIEKVEFRHSASTIGEDSFYINLTSNYWETTDSNLIADLIIDATDDSALASTANYNGYLSSMDMDCPGQNTASANKVQPNVIGVYPNPVHNLLNINQGTDPIIKATILGINGSVVMEQDKRSIDKIDVSELTSGLYYLILQNNQGQELRAKFIKN